MVNRTKTRTLRLSEPGVGLDFLGYTFRYDRDLRGRPWKYLNLCPSKKAMQHERDKLRELTSPSKCFMPAIMLVAQINQHLIGWGNYFAQGYPRKAFRRVNHFVQERLVGHLQRRSQRPYRPTAGVS